MNDSLPSFDRADYVSTTAPAAIASTPDAAPRYGTDLDATVGGRNHAAYVRAIAFGIGAAVAGCALYAGVEIATGWTIGYVALAVGYMVGKAMKAGSSGRGGRRYQIAAAILTYASVSMAAIPVMVHQVWTHPPQKAARAQAAAANPGGEKFPFPEDPAEQAPAKPAPHGPLYFVTMLLLAGLASPLLELTDGIGGFIGLFILFIGIRAAWQLTAGSEEGMDERPHASGPTTLSLR